MKKWIFRILGLLLVLIIGLVVYIEINKEELVAIAVDETNKSIDGTISYQDADVSLFSSFPDLEISINQAVIRDAILKETTPLAVLGNMSLSIDLISAIKQEVKINSVSMSDGVVYIANYKDGSNNYSLSKESNESQSTGAIDFKINSFSMENMDFLYKDELTNSSYAIKEFSNKGDLKYKGGVIDMSNDFSGKLSVQIASILPSYAMSFKGQMQNAINSNYDSINISNADVVLNDLPIQLDGHISLGESIKYTFDFGSPSTAIKRLLSVMPNFYRNQYESLIGKGTYVLKGSVNGNTANDYPTYKMSLMAKDGSLKYPDLNAQIDNFSFGLVAENTNPSLAYTRLVVNDIDLAAGSNTIKGSFLSLPQGNAHKTNIDIDANLILEELTKSIKLDPTTVLNGSIKGSLKGNALIDAKTNEVRAGDERFDMDLALNNIEYKDDIQSFTLNNGIIKGNPDRVNFQADGIKYGEVLDMDLKGFINEPLQTALIADQVIAGDIEIQARTIDLNKLPVTESDSLASNYTIPITDINYSFKADRFVQGIYELETIEASGQLKPAGATTKFSIQDLMGSKMKGTGTFDNLLDYTLNGETLTGDLEIFSNRLDLEKFMGDDQSSATDASDSDLIPKNIALNIDYNSEQIGFRNIDILRSLGKVSIKDQKIIFENKGDLFGGKIGLTGTFDTNLPEGSNLDLKLELKDLQFAETAKNIEIFNKLLPIAKLLEGKYTASLNWNSNLSDDYMPDLNSLTAYGVIQTEDGGIKSSLPIDSIIRSLNIIGSDKQPLKISNAKKYFIVEDGKVMVKEIKLEQDDIAIIMSGSHSFMQELDYKMLIDIPKSKLKADAVISFLQDKVRFNDLLKKAGEDVTIQVEGHMGGTVLKPIFSLKAVNLKNGDVVENIQDQIVSTITEIKDSIETEIRDTIAGYIDKGNEIVDSIKNKVNETVDSLKEVGTAIVDSAKIVLNEEIDKQKEEVKEEATGILGDILAGKTDSIAPSIDDIFKNKQSQLDSLSKKFPINLFKRKK